MKLSTRYILSLDAGFSSMGWSVYSSSRRQFVAAGVIRTKKEPKCKSVASDDLRRVVEQLDGLAVISSRYSLSQVVAELPHGGAQNASAMADMARAATIIIAFCHSAKLPLFHVTPNQVKAIAAPGHGNKKVPKEVVQEYAASKWGTTLWPNNSQKEHVADSMVALEVFLRHLKEKV